jgi:hypothetical protein
MFRLRNKTAVCANEKKKPGIQVEKCKFEEDAQHWVEVHIS